MPNKISFNAQMLKGYETREEVLDGITYIVAPVTMMVEGVLAGSRGPLLHLADEFGHVPAAYNGIPVTIQHPQDESGNYVSANSPDVLSNWSVGKIFSTILADNKLKSEAWVDKKKCETLSKETLAALEAGTILEVSIGVFTDEEETPGVYNGKKYNAIARNHKPDHLALLPGAVGACSVKDGCGIRVNSSQTKKGGQSNVEVLTAIQVLKESGYAVPSSFQLNKDETGYEEKLMSLRNLVRGLNPQNQINGYMFTKGSVTSRFQEITFYNIFTIFEDCQNNFTAIWDPNLNLSILCIVVGDFFALQFIFKSEHC